MPTATTAAPFKQICFTFITAAGWTYPVTVAFDRRLPMVQVVGMPECAVRDLRQRDCLHKIAPRCRMIVTVGGQDGDDQKWRDLRASGYSLADQLFVALQSQFEVR